MHIHLAEFDCELRVPLRQRRRAQAVHAVMASDDGEFKYDGSAALRERAAQFWNGLPADIKQHDRQSLLGRSRDYTVERMAYHAQLLQAPLTPPKDTLWAFLAGDGSRCTLSVQSQPHYFDTKALISEWYDRRSNPQAVVDWTTLKQVNATQTTVEGNVGWWGRMRTTMTWGEKDATGMPRLTRNEGVMVNATGLLVTGLAYTGNVLKSWF